MGPRTKALVAAGSGITVGLAGLALSTLPAGADDDPVLPAIDAQELVTSALEARAPAFSGVAEVRNELGLPSLPGVETLDAESVRVFHDGEEGARVQAEQESSELTFVKNADEAWAYDSQERAAKKLTWDDADATAAREHAGAEAADPSQAAAEIIERLRPTSDVAVDGTARVAGRPAYELVLTPRPDEKTLLREVTVAIDEQTRIPLRFDVFANGASDPVLSLGFVEFEVGAQPADLFEFTPPRGTRVETAGADDAARTLHDARGADDGQDLTTVGDGWDTVVIAEMPDGVPAASAEGGLGGSAGAGGEGQGDLLGQIGTPVSGAFGSGTHVSTAVGGAVVTDDGRVAAGVVPLQVLVDALDGETDGASR